MLSYSAIIQKAYRITLSYPSLWLFGLFVVGGFNLNYLHFEHIPLRRLILESRFLETVNFFQGHPGFLALASLSVLVFTLGGLIISNWSRIMLILLGQAALKNKNLNLPEQLKKSADALGTIIKISLLTSGLILVVALALFAWPIFLEVDANVQNLLLLAGLLIFLPLTFTISCINIFTTFYAVVYKKSIGAALNLGTDLFVSRWPQILGLVVVLMVIYLGSFILGISLIFLARLVFDHIFLLLLRFNILPFSAIIIMLKFIYNLLLWFLLAGLSVFFNQALLILFFELNTPIENAEAAKEPVVAPAV